MASMSRLLSGSPRIAHQSFTRIADSAAIQRLARHHAVPQQTDNRPQYISSTKESPLHSNHAPNRKWQRSRVLNTFPPPTTTNLSAKQYRHFSLSKILENQNPKVPDKNTPAPPTSPSSSLPGTDPSPSTPPLPIPEVLKSITPTHENIYTLPNLLTTTRVITAPIISWALLTSQPTLAFTLFAYSSITDLVDGYLARRYNSHTVLGSILDPFADKLLMTLTTITLYSIGTFPWWLTFTILGRDFGLLLSALYFRWISLPHPRTMKRYWDFSLPSAEVRPTEISKINTLLQFLLVANAVLLPVLPVGIVESWNLWGVLQGWMGLVAGTTVWSGASYLFTKDAIRFIGKENGEGGEKKTGKDANVM